jgi:hypothetical protein
MSTRASQRPRNMTTTNTNTAASFTMVECVIHSSEQTSDTFFPSLSLSRLPPDNGWLVWGLNVEHVAHLVS